MECDVAQQGGARDQQQRINHRFGKQQAQSGDQRKAHTTQTKGGKRDTDAQDGDDDTAEMGSRVSAGGVEGGCTCGYK